MLLFGGGGNLISAVRFFPTGALIRGGALISAVRVFPTGALIRGGALNRILRVDILKYNCGLFLLHDQQLFVISNLIF